MALALVSPQSGRVSCIDFQERTAEVVSLDEMRSSSSRLVPLAGVSAISVSVALPLVQIMTVALGLVNEVKGGDKWLWTLLATAIYLPFHLRHVVYAARGARASGARWTLTVMALVIFGALPLAGIGWLWAFSSLAVSVLLLLRPPWSTLCFVALVAAPVPLAFVFDDARLGPYFAMAVVWRSTPFVFIWLASAIRELENARQALVGTAVEQERLRIDAELRQTLGAGLQEIVDRGTAASASASRSTPAVEGDVRILVAGARSTLAQARRMVRGYQQVQLRSELDTAVALLSAAGIEARVVAIDLDLVGTVDETLTTTLRSGIAALLQDGKVRACVLTVRSDGGKAGLHIQTELVHPIITEVSEG
jgi:two-component system sensor histidine kinase DesK